MSLKSDTHNEDWLKTKTWDLPNSARALEQMLGRDMTIALLTLPAGRAMPATLRAEIEVMRDEQKGVGWDPDQPRDAYGRFSETGGGGEGAPETTAAYERASSALRNPDLSPGTRRANVEAMHNSMYEAGKRVLGEDGYQHPGKVKAELSRKIAARMKSTTKKLLGAMPTVVGASDLAAAVRDKNQMLARDQGGGVHAEPYYAMPPGGGGAYEYARGGTPEADAMAREYAVSSLVGQWAGTANDSIPKALAIQNAARAEFGLKGTNDWPMSDDLARNVREDTKSNGGVYKDFLRAQYDETQDRFKALGISEVTLARGSRWNPGEVQWSGEKSPQPKPWVSYAVNKTRDRGGSEQYMRTRPLSSWTSNAGTAVNFGAGAKVSVVSYATFPVEQILSSAKTGLGCLHESEFVVLGGRFRSIVVGRKQG